MPLRAPTIWLALIASISILFLCGCSTWGDSVPVCFRPVPTSTSQPVSYRVAVPASANARAIPELFPLQTIRGGLSGNVIVGVACLPLQRPVAVAARDRLVYIADGDQQTIFRYDTSNGDLTAYEDLRGRVSGDVAYLYLASDGSLYVADSVGGRVLRFDRHGRFAQTFANKLNLIHPVALWVDDKTREVYIADGTFDHIVVFSSDGNALRALGGRGQNEGEFLNTTSMAHGPDGVYVTTRLGEVRGQVLDLQGQFLYSFDPNTTVFPNGIAVDADNRAYVTDFFDNSIKIFQHGQLLATVGGNGASTGRFKGIAGVWLDGRILYVADSLNRRVQVFRIGQAAAK